MAPNAGPKHTYGRFNEKKSARKSGISLVSHSLNTDGTALKIKKEVDFIIFMERYLTRIGKTL
jgi:hypothetical protein